ncbi:anti-sigma factor [Sphingomonas sp. ERG5]|uniref:anti-sigma factor n=1 Tax=Sphingomonas sp. ERG5 TaxID=1381597 RepID=UPI00054C6F16|nr:anti-sigma factor [Sphingomonas sp. ERG5]
MSEDAIPTGKDPDAAAAELALGLLEGEERVIALRRVLAEPGFAQDVERWRVHLGQLFDIWPEVAAPPGMMDRIDLALDGPAAPPPVTLTRTGRLWPGIAAASSLIAASLLLVVLIRPMPPVPAAIPPKKQPVATAPARMLVASIDPSAAGKPVTVVYDPASGSLRLTESTLADANRSAELWVIAGDGVPHSLGLLHISGGTTFTVTGDNRARLSAGATLAVSLEPVGGSPTGLPTGPVVATGALSQV